MASLPIPGTVPRLAFDGNSIRLNSGVVVAYRESPVGTVAMWLTATAPSGWVILDGAAISRTTYADLFALWGTTFGSGDGTTTFNLPDMRQKFPLGKAASGTGSTLGGTGGTIDHVHAVDVASTVSGVPSATVEVQSLMGGTVVATGTHTHVTDPTSVNSGSANPPFLAVNFIVRAV